MRPFPIRLLATGEIPFPHGYGLLPVDRIAHVQVNDCQMEGHTPICRPTGDKFLASTICGWNLRGLSAM